MNAAAAVQEPNATVNLPMWQPSGWDRCDRCGSQAYVKTILLSGSTLLFCAHHYRKHAPKLLISARIFDRTDCLIAVA